MSKTTFVTDIRYGELPVKKVYLGEKLIWQRVAVAGDAESTSYTKALFYLPILDAIIGDAPSVSYDNAGAKALELSLMISKTEAATITESGVTLAQLLELKSEKNEYLTHTNSVGTLIEALPAYTIAESNSFSNTIGYALDSEQMGGSSDIESNGIVLGRMLVVNDLKSEAEIHHATSATAIACMPEPVNGSFVIDFNTKDADGRAVYAINVSSDAASQFATTAVGSSVLPLNTKAFAESTSSGNSVIYVFDALLVGGSASTQDVAKATCTLFNAVLMSSNINAVFSSSATTSIQWAVPSQSRIDHSSNGDSFIGKYFATGSNGDADTASYGSASPVLWYVPIGDGIPLAESDGIDITVNGNTLEIQQAYQINIDDEKGILEVI